jgi:cystathionine beta-lyase
MNMEIDFNTLPNRHNTECSKWDTYDKDVLPMWVADMDFKSPQPIIDALKTRVDHGVFGYSLPPENLKETIVNWVARRHGWQITEDDIVFIPGVVSGFNLAAHAVTRPGDGYLVQTPTYGPFFRIADNVKLIQHEMELTHNGNGYYKIDMDAFEAALTCRTRIFMLFNPQNPTGRVFHKDELEAMAEICLKYNIIICSDEIHSDLIFSGNKHIPIASLDPQIADRTITLIAPSKTFNIAGLGASVAIITDKALRKQFENARQGLLGGVNLLGMVAMEAAYARSENWLDELLVYLESNRNFLNDFVRSELPGIKMGNPEGTYLAWLDCRELGIEGKPSEFFLKTARVAMNNGEWFGKGGEGFVRLNFGCPKNMLDESLCRMKQAIFSI